MQLVFKKRKKQNRYFFW